MTIESATYVADLQPVNPPSTDPTSQGDDHIRLIKQVLQNQFPGSSRAWAIPGVQTFSTSPVTVAKAMDGSTLFISTASGATVVNLPVLAAADAGWTVHLFKTSLDTNPMFVTPPSGNILSGGYSVVKARRCIPSVRSTAIWTGTQFYLTRVSPAPISVLLDFYSAVLPAGFEWPNGQTLASGNYPEYFAAVGSYATPDVRGYTGIPLDNLGGMAAGRLPNGVISGSALGATGGADAVAMTAAQMPVHYHTASVADPSHTHGVSGGVYGSTGLVYNYYSGGGQGGAPGAITINSSTTGVYLTSSNGTNTTNSAGSGAVLPRMQPSIMLGKLLVVE